jgi:diguanylate cyclase (GGDEF)-like protein
LFVGKARRQFVLGDSELESHTTERCKTTGIPDALRAENEALRNEVRVLRIQVGELERLADTDTLTPLLNRRAFLREVERQIARVTRSGESVAIMVADVDGLKAINDRDGHLAGDNALIHVGYTMKAQVRATDIVARIGGDEFALIMEDLDGTGAAAKARSLAASIATGGLESGLGVSISIGHAIVEAGDTVDSVIARADASMYASKLAQRSDQRSER